MSFMTPLWWIRAFELALEARRFTKDPFSLSGTSGLSPALTDIELNALIVMIQLAQSQIFSKSGTLVFSAEELQKHDAYRSPAKSFLFQRLLQLLPAVRIDAINTLSDGHISSLHLFQDEGSRQIAGGLWEASFRLPPLAPECILGYADAYGELLRLIEGKPRAHRYLGTHAPLPLRPALWLDLLGIEQFLFLQLQKATFWDKGPIHWEPVFGKPLDELFGSLELPERKARSSENHLPESLFRRRLRVLKRLGRKLLDHGLIRRVPEIDFLALDPANSAVSLLWSGQEMLEEGQAINKHERQCSEYFCEQLPSLMMKLTPVLSAEGTTKVEASLQLCKQLEVHMHSFSENYIRIEGNLILPLIGLFLEWKIRINSKGILRLPAWLEASEILKTPDHEPLAEQLLRFMRVMADAADLKREIEHVPLATLAAPVTLKQRHVLEFLASHSLDSASSKQLNPLQNPLHSSGPVSTKLGRSPSLNAPAGGSAKKGYGDIEIKRQAVSELQRMREADPQRYNLLKQQYLENLDRERKNIILEMQKRMHPHAFDDHLKHSLVKYMIDHPRSWQNGDSSRSLP